MARYIAAVFLALACLLGCAQSPLSERMGAAARAKGQVDLAALTDFEWDTVFVFSPYATSDSICKSVGAQWPECARLAPRQVPESEFHLVFVSQGAFVRQVPHSRKNGDFCKATCALAIPKSEAVFYVQPATPPDESHFYLFTQNAS